MGGVMKRFSAVVALLAAVLVSSFACAPRPLAGLAGSSWRLAHFRASEHATEVVVPPRVERYTARFLPDGTLAMQVDCNRVSTRWQAEPSSASAGSLTIAPGAMTRAMCGPGAMDARIAADLAAVRSYRLTEGRLHLALAADAGTYVWDRQEGSGN